MKYKLIGISATALALIAVMLISICMPNDLNKRFVEHVMAEEKTPCNSHKNNELCTHLPIIKIDTHGKDMPGKPIIVEKENFVIGYTLTENGESQTLASIDVIQNKGKNNHLSDSSTSLGDVLIRMRGHSSRRFEKANYFIRFVNPDKTNNPKSFLGMDSHHEWALHGPFLDKSLIRNYMWYNIAGEIMEYSPNVRFFELILNGEYRGLYLATEMITAGKEGARLPLSVSKKDNTFSGYALRLDWGDGNEESLLYPFTNYTLKAKNQHEFVYPGTKNLTPELKKSIKDDFSQFEKALYSYNYNDKTHGYRKYIDVQSFIDYFLINEVCCNYDAGSLSTYIYKDVNGKFKMCVWDFNSAVDGYQESAMPTNEFWLTNAVWYEMLFKDSDFTENVIDRYFELRKTYFSKEYLFDFIDSTVEYLGEAVGRNYEKWGHTFKYEYDLLTPHERNPRNYEESISQMKDFLSKRIDFLDENIESLRQLSAKSKTKSN